MAKSFGYEVQAVFFDVPLDVCLDRNRQRERSVSEDVMRRMAEKLKPPVFERGLREDHGGAGEERRVAFQRARVAYYRPADN